MLTEPSLLAKPVFKKNTIRAKGFELQVEARCRTPLGRRRYCSKYLWVESISSEEITYSILNSLLFATSHARVISALRWWWWCFCVITSRACIANAFLLARITCCDTSTISTVFAALLQINTTVAQEKIKTYNSYRFSRYPVFLPTQAFKPLWWDNMISWTWGSVSYEMRVVEVVAAFWLLVILFALALGAGYDC